MSKASQEGCDLRVAGFCAQRTAQTHSVKSPPDEQSLSPLGVKQSARTVDEWPPAHGTNALIYETNPGRENWTAFEGSEGAALAFPGGLAAHFTSENTTGVTRWSIDARVVADSSTSAYDAGSYFAVAERVGGAWRRVGDEIGAVDPRVGIPFDRN